MLLHLAPLVSQDLSIAGKRAGLKHTENGDGETTRSGLFMEAIRIIKEMRSATNGQYPRYAVWENVPGAFSSNKGEDFRVVLEELIKIVEPAAEVPPAPKGRWPYADAYMGDGWSLAYRTFDAQYWGVPQRRRRIYLVADFVGGCAPAILFEFEGVRGYLAESGTPWKSTSAHIEGCIGADDRESIGLDIYNLAVTGDVAASLTTATGQGASNTGPSVAVPCTLEPGIAQREGGHIYEGVSGTIRVNMGDNQMAMAYGVTTKGNGDAFVSEERHTAVSCGGGQAGQGYPCVMHIADQHIRDDRGGSFVNVRTDGNLPTLRDEMHGNVPCVAENEAGSCAETSAKERWVGGQEVTSALRTGVAPAVCVKAWDARGNGGGETVNTITGDHENRVTDYTSVIVEPIVFAANQRDEVRDLYGKTGALQAQPGMKQQTFIAESVYRLQGNGIDRADTAGCSGKGRKEDASYALNTNDRPAVVYAVDQGGGKSGANVSENTSPTLCTTHGGEPAVCYGTFAMQGFGDYKESDTASGLKARDWKDATDLVAEPIAIDRAFFNQGQNALYDPKCYTDGTNPTLVARGPNAVAVRYIVRRLTPTECARLQGFADRWGHPDPKENFADEEYSFWLKVRNTYAELNDRVVKDYTKDQMLTWYNKLHSDSAEYKMWGNGIALPPTLYVMQGIAGISTKRTMPNENRRIEAFETE